MQTPDMPTPTSEKDLDKALKDTFPASDPVAAVAQLTATPTEPSTPATAQDGTHPGTVTIYRVVGEDQKDKPFAASGNSAGRWTSEGTPAVYASLSASTALLEFLVHCEGTPAETAYLARAVIPQDRIVSLQAYPSTWRERPYRAEVRQVGDAWSTSHQSLAAQVPSALVEESGNVILNPEHVDAPLLQSVEVLPVRIDDRLRRTAAG